MHTIVVGGNLDPLQRINCSFLHRIDCFRPSVDYTAIDFETANQRRDSACQLAAVVVRDGQIVERKCWLLRPRPFYFSRFNIAVHGIRPEDVEHQPEFGDLWPEIAPFLSSTCVVAHNAAFDLGVLLECIRCHGKEIPSLEFTCTRLLAKAAWPGRPGYGLKPLANWLGIQFRHHDALEDAVACARILLAIAATTGARQLTELETKLKFARGVANADAYVGPKRQLRGKRTSAWHGARRTSQASSVAQASSVSAVGRAYHPGGSELAFDPADSQPTAPLDLQRLFVRAEFLRSLRGKQVVMKGTFRRLSHENARLLVQKLGATIQVGLNEQTDYVIDGDSAQARDASAVPLLSEQELIGLVQQLPCLNSDDEP